VTQSGFSANISTTPSPSPLSTAPRASDCPRRALLLLARSRSGGPHPGTSGFGVTPDSPVTGCAWPPLTPSGPSIGSRVASIRTTTLFSWSLFILRSERKLNQLGNDLIEQGHCPSPAGRATFDLVREARHDESVSRQLHARAA